MLGLLPIVLLATAPDLALLGIVSHPDPARSAAILRAEGRQRVVTIGETAFGGRLSEIKEASVVLAYGDENVEVRLAEASDAAASIAAFRQPVRTHSTSSRSTGKVMVRAEVERRLTQEIPRILAETTIVPAREAGGRVAGFTLTRLAENSLLTDAGLRPGDVLTEVNGTPIDSMATLASLYGRLAGEKELRAIVLRDGRPVPLSITLR